mgnify:CR=1 FL=1
MNTAKTLELLQSEAAYARMCELYGAEKAEENIRRYGELVKKFRENFGENFRRERPKTVRSRSRKTRMKPSKTGKSLPKSQLDFESFSLRPLRYISIY